MNQPPNNWFCSRCGFNNLNEWEACKRCQYVNPFAPQSQPQQPKGLAKLSSKTILIAMFAFAGLCGLCGFLGIIANRGASNSSTSKSNSNQSPSFLATPATTPSATNTSRVEAPKPQTQQSSVTRGSSSDRRRLADRIGRDMTANRVPSWVMVSDKELHVTYESAIIDYAPTTFRNNYGYLFKELYKAGFDSIVIKANQDSGGTGERVILLKD